MHPEPSRDELIDQIEQLKGQLYKTERKLFGNRYEWFDNIYVKPAYHIAKWVRDAPKNALKLLYRITGYLFRITPNPLQNYFRLTRFLNATAIWISVIWVIRYAVLSISQF